MSVLPDWMIKHQVKISPAAEMLNRPGVISYGYTSYGYDARVGTKFLVARGGIYGNRQNITIDPKEAIGWAFTEHEGGACIIPPNSFALAETVESFKIPRDVLAICVGKSTYARCGIIVNVTPLEPEWEGKITVEISNTTPLPARIYANEGIMQIIFLRGAAGCETSYADKKGKYQGQTGLTLPIVL